MLAWLTASLTAMAGLAARSRRLERAADRYATRVLGQPLAPDAAAWLDARHPRPPHWTRWWWSHPSWPQRVTAM
jgi:hypothetical protein